MKNRSDSLKGKISLLKNKQANELELLKEQFHLTSESLKPINLVKNTWHEVTSSANIKNGIVNNVIGLTTGYLSRKVLVGASHNPLKRLLGTFLQFTIGNIASKHTDTIKEKGKGLLRYMFKDKN